jgi:hypothetical protein
MPGEFSEASERAYYATRQKNRTEDTDDPHFMFNRGFYLGAQFAMRTSSELSPHLARFMEFIMWMTERENSD